MSKENKFGGFPGGPAVKGSDIVTIVALVTAAT